MSIPIRTISNHHLWTWLTTTAKLDSEIHVSMEAMLEYERILRMPTFKVDSLSYCEEIRDSDPVLKYYAGQHLIRWETELVVVKS